MTTKDTGSNKTHIGGSSDDMRQTEHREGTKTSKAYEIWDQMHKKDPNVARHLCIEAAQQEADMTPASASTIYQSWRTENGLVNHPGEDDNRNTGMTASHGTGSKSTDKK